MDYKVQILSLAVVLTIIFNYFRNRRLPLMSTKFFTAFLVLSAVNLSAEIIAMYSLSHLDTVFPFFARISHQIFIGSMDCMTFFLFLYAGIKANVQRRYRIREMLVRMLPAAASMIVVVFGRLEYLEGPKGAYSQGPMFVAVYGSMAVYLLWTARILYRANSSFSKESRTSILVGMALWFLIVLYQVFHPMALISAISNVLMVLFIYLSFENPREYMDLEANTLNPRAFHLMLAELGARKRKFYLVNLSLDDAAMLQKNMGHMELPKILGEIAKQMADVTGERIYHSKSNMLSILAADDRNFAELMEGLENSEFFYQYEEDAEKLNYHITVLECPRYAGDREEVMCFLDYLKKDMDMRNDSRRIIYIDEQIIQNKNYLEAVKKLVQKALEEDGFEVYYQPIYSTGEERFISAEALVRLKDKETLGFVSPEVFIPIAEEYGMIRKLGGMVFEKVCRFAKEYQLWNCGIRYIEVNISGVQGTDPSLPDTIDACLKHYGIEPYFINLEITETASVDAGDVLSRNMSRLRSMGCNFSMDDFGTGYSNLAKMAQLHFELIKLDKSLIWPCFEENGEEALVILTSCIHMIHQLGMKIVAEGVENEAQMETLKNLGVSCLQGYLFSRPLPEKEYLAFLGLTASKEGVEARE